MADPSPGRPGLEALADELTKLKRAIRDLSSPSGTQQYNAVPTLQQTVDEVVTQQGILASQQATLTELVDNLDERITDFLENDLEALVESKVTAAVAAALSASDITIGQAGGRVRMPSLYTTNVVPTGQPRIVVWVTEDGTVGHT